MYLILINCCYCFILINFVYRARWRENRTIFNTPNPRLMNVSLLRENKLLHQERRGSRGSARGPSRQPSMASLRAHSPNSQGKRVWMLCECFYDQFREQSALKLQGGRKAVSQTDVTSELNGLLIFYINFATEIL